MNEKTLADVALFFFLALAIQPQTKKKPGYPKLATIVTDLAWQS